MDKFQQVTSFYDIGYPDSSNFMELEIGVHSNYYIIASKGSIEFSTIVGRKANDEGYIRKFSNSRRVTRQIERWLRRQKIMYLQIFKNH